MRTTHRIHVDDARDMHQVEDGSVELVVTSPPYPMIEMWDELFTELDPAIGEDLEAGRGQQAFERMHAAISPVWEEMVRVLAPGGIACINVGDATRSVDDSFRQYPNHVRIVDALCELGLQPLPDILWRKPANSAAKFMGSGMLPPNAYATLEHEYVLVFRKGERKRSLPPGADRRYEAAYFWEERNRWFSDVWTDVRGTMQTLEGDSRARERSGAFPLALPFRLVCMYSVYGDTVLDPFWGTGTSTIAAMVAGRSSIGYEIEPAFVDAFDERVGHVASLSHKVASERIRRHRAFVQRRRKQGEQLGYEAEHYGFPVTTKQEQRIRLYVVDDLAEEEDGFSVEHRGLDANDVPEGTGEPAEDEADSQRARLDSF